VISRLGIVGWLAALGLELVALVVWGRSGFETPGYAFMRGPAAMVALFVGTTLQATAGAILMRRRPENRVGWLIMAFALTMATSTVVIAATAGLEAGDSEPIRWLAWVGSALFAGASLLAIALAFVFPDGRLISRGWGSALALVVAACFVAGTMLVLRPGALFLFPAIENPLSMATARQGSPGAAAVALLIASGAIGAASLLWRYRISVGVRRVQIRWYIASGVLLAATYVAQLVALLMLDPLDPRGELITTLSFLVLGVPPVAMTMAILRYRLYDIDQVISRAFVYGALTAVLAGIYTASIRLFNALFTEITGQDSEATLVITTLLLATTFTPIKLRLERFASRHLGRTHKAAATQAASDPAASGQPARHADRPTVDYLADPAFVAAVDARVHATLGGLAPGSAVAAVDVAAPDPTVEVSSLGNPGR
jgi:hypothetical protein